MTSTRLWLTTIFGTALVAGASAASNYVPNQVLVKFKPSAFAVRFAPHMLVGAQVTREIPQIGVQTITLPKGMTVPQALRYYRGLSNVQYAEPNYIRPWASVPNDPLYNQQYMPTRISMPQAWDLSLGEPTVRVAVLDTGVNYNHEDLKGKIVLGKDFFNKDDDPMDDVGHGTHCAGDVAANTNNGVGIAGTGYNVAVIAEKVGDAAGAYDDMVAAGMVDALDRGASVISMSFGGPGSSQVEQDALNNAYKRGAVLVAAAGNSNVSTTFYPAGFDNVIAVGASDKNDARADFSNYGSNWVDVAAPGVAILSTTMDGKYEAWDGTSMATPIVAGLVGLMKSYAPEATNAELRTALEAGCDPISGNWVSKGRVNGFKALSNLVQPIVMEFDAKSVAVYQNQGSSMTGTPSYLTKVDSAKVSLQSVYQAGAGSVAAVQTALAFDATPSKVRTASFQFTGQAPRDVTVQIYLYNFNTGRYEIYKSFPATGNNQTLDIPVTNLSKYVSGSTINMIVRGWRSAAATRTAGQTYVMSMDQLRLKATLNR